jgi:hypothetical protein
MPVSRTSASGVAPYVPASVVGMMVITDHPEATGSRSRIA